MFRDLKEYQEIAKIYAEKVSKPEDLEERRGSSVEQLKKNRETVLPAGVYEYMEKYMRTSGGAKDGLYMYNFCLDSNKRTYQPSGAMNVNKFKKVFFEFNTVEVPLDISGSNIEYICDLNGNAIGFRKTSAVLNEYNFDLRIFEERYNILIIQGGRIGLLNAR